MDALAPSIDWTSPNILPVLAKNDTVNELNFQRYAVIDTSSGYQVYRCTVCQKTERHRNNMRKHIVRHTGEKAHTCQLCGKAFTRGTSLKKHIAWQHAQQLGKSGQDDMLAPHQEDTFTSPIKKIC